MPEYKKENQRKNFKNMSFHKNAKADYYGCCDWKDPEGKTDKLQLY